MSVRLVWATPQGDNLIAYMARVSSDNQDNPEIEKLIGYCIKHKHWSIFEMVSMCVEIQCSRAIGRQIIRHRSFSFQEFSQRYSEVGQYEIPTARLQAKKNRQSSIETEDEMLITWFNSAIEQASEYSKSLYNQALEMGIAKEQARFLLTENFRTKMYMNGTLRSWIHYLQLRTKPDTQKEHRDVALAIDNIFRINFPITYKGVKEHDI